VAHKRNKSDLPDAINLLILKEFFAVNFNHQQKAHNKRPFADG
jgi:hypothetical protein